MNSFLLQFSNDWFFAYTEPVSRTSCTSSFPSAMSSLGKSLSSDGLPSNHLNLRTRESVQLALSNGFDDRNRSTITFYPQRSSLPHLPKRSRSSLAPQHTLKPCLLDDANLVDQNSKQITIILRSFRWSAGTDCHLSQQISALTLRSIGLGTAQLHLTFGFFFCFSSKVHCLLL